MDSAFTEDKMHKRIEELGAFLRPLVELEGERALKEFDILLGDKPRGGHPHVLKYFVVKRRESIDKQLSGESQGERLNFNLPPGLIRTLLGIGIAVLFATVLNAGAWLWGVIAGFKGSTTWGLLNMFFYPITPITYGFFARKDIGRNAAIMVACACLFFAVVVIVSVMMLSP